MISQPIQSTTELPVKGSAHTIHSVGRAITLLQALADSPDSLTLTELAHRLKTTKTTIHRLVAVLRGAGLVAYAPESRRYRMGYRVLEWSAATLRQSNLVQVSHPHMEHLRDISGETICLHVRAGDGRTCIHQVEGKHELRMVMNVGHVLPINVGSAGRVLMAGMSGAEFEAAMAAARWQSYAPNTICEPDRWRKAVKEAAPRGYSTASDERIIGTASIAVPIRNSHGETVGALSIYGPTARLSQERLLSFASEIEAAATAISRELRCVGLHPTSSVNLGSIHQ